MVVSGIHVQTAVNTGIIQSPVIWVEQLNGLDNKGTIQSILLIVGTKKID